MNDKSRRSIKKRKKNNISRIALSIVGVFIILSAAFLLMDNIPNYFQRVIAGEMNEEVDDFIDENTSDINEDNGNSDDINTGKNEEGFEKDSNSSIDLEKEDNTEEQDKNNDKELVKNTDDILIVVNKKRYLAPDYKPSDLVVPNIRFSFDGEHEKKYMRQEAASALEDLFNRANEEGIHLYAVSGYRSYSTQERLFKNRADRVGEEEANKLSARPGESEHQTGLAMDVTSQSAGFDLIEAFGDTEEGKWLKENAHKSGFIIRYLKEKTDITGYSYEPWHIRYVGKDVAEKIYNEGITLEEYFGLE